MKKANVIGRQINSLSVLFEMQTMCLFSFRYKIIMSSVMKAKDRFLKSSHLGDLRILRVTSLTCKKINNFILFVRRKREDIRLNSMRHYLNTRIYS